MTAAGKRLSSKKQTAWTVSRGLPYLVSSREAKEALVGGWEGGRSFLLLRRVPHWGPAEGSSSKSPTTQIFFFLFFYLTTQI